MIDDETSTSRMFFDIHLWWLTNEHYVLWHIGTHNIKTKKTEASCAGGAYKIPQETKVKPVASVKFIIDEVRLCMESKWWKLLGVALQFEINYAWH